METKSQQATAGPSKKPMPVRVVVTGACSEIAKVLVMMILRGDLFGRNTLIDIVLVETQGHLPKLIKGTSLEVYTCNFPLLLHMECTKDTAKAFQSAEYIFLAGGFPTDPVFSRNDIISSNGLEFKNIGIALRSVDNPNCKILVVTDPQNCNLAVICQFAPNLNPKQITGLSRVDHNRCLAKLAKMLYVTPAKITRVAIFGNSIERVYPDLRHAKVEVLGKFDDVYGAVGDDYYLKFDFVRDLHVRSHDVYMRRKATPSLTVATAALQHMKVWIEGTPETDWTSMVVLSDGSYEIEKGLPYSFPVRVNSEGIWEIVHDLDIDFFEKEKLIEAEEIVRKERNFAFALLGLTDTQNSDERIPMEWSFGNGKPIPCRQLGPMERQRMMYF